MDFFKENESDLQSGFFGNITIEEAIEKTINEGDELFRKLKDNDGSNLSTLFQPLNNLEFKTKDFQKQKAKGQTPKAWLRIYAIYYDEKYIITGGTLKLTLKMENRDHTDLELKKLNLVRDTLKLNEDEVNFVYLD